MVKVELGVFAQEGGQFQLVLDEDRFHGKSRFPA
jgi:hypothetical protein